MKLGIYIYLPHNGSMYGHKVHNKSCIYLSTYQCHTVLTIYTCTLIMWTWIKASIEISLHKKQFHVQGFCTMDSFTLYFCQSNMVRLTNHQTHQALNLNLFLFQNQFAPVFSKWEEHLNVVRVGVYFGATARSLSPWAPLLPHTIASPLPSLSFYYI